MPPEEMTKTDDTHPIWEENEVQIMLETTGDFQVD